MEKYIEKGFGSIKLVETANTKFKNIGMRIRYGLNEGVSITASIWYWVLLGVAVGAFIHNYIPEALVQSIVGKGGFFTVPLATLLGVPMYGGCAAIVPVAVALFDKGVPIGTALAFMMAVAALSLPEAIILRRAMKLKLIGVFFGIVTLGIIFTGYLLNYLAPLLISK